MPTEVSQRVFVLERTRLSELNSGYWQAERGDLVVFLREAQDLDGKAAQILQARGVCTIWGPSLLTKNDSVAIDAFLRRYLKKWFIVDGTDVSDNDGLSLGLFVGNRLSMAQKPTLIVTLAEICRLAFKGIKDNAILTTDIDDGDTMFNNFVRHSDICPRRRLLEKIAHGLGWQFDTITPDLPIPNVHRSTMPPGRIKPYIDFLRRLIGGFRPTFIIGRLKARRGKSGNQRIYIYLIHGIKHIAETLAHRAGTQVFCDQPGVPGTTLLRYDHLLTRVNTGLRQAAARMMVRLRELENSPGIFIYNEFDYGPYLLPGLRIYLEKEFHFDLRRMDQGLKLLDAYRFDMMVVTGDIAHMYATMARARSSGCQAVYLAHGINLFRAGLRDAHLNHADTIYIVPGSDHQDDYGPGLPTQSKPRRPVLGNPAITQMGKVLSGPSPSGSPRILLANFTPKYANYSGVFYYCDRYMHDILTVAQRLLKKGFRITYRPHPGDEPAYIAFMLSEMGLADSVDIDLIPDFTESLHNHDVFVANTTTCIYQALYAGWPTIFYDPKPDPDQLVGMPVAFDIPHPVACTPDELEAAIIDAVEGHGDVARFPELFRTKFASRFIGPTGQQMLDQMADFMSNTLNNTENSDLTCSRSKPAA